jgi:DNA-binding CsgD family transcriptional regulator
MVSSLFPFLWTSGYLSEGREWLATLLARQPANPPNQTRAWALAVVAKLQGHHGEHLTTPVIANEYLALPPELQSGPGLAQVHTALGLAALHEGDLALARHHATIAVEESRACGEYCRSMYPTYLGAVAIAEGKLDEAQALFQTSLDEARAVDFQLPVGLALQGLARVARLRGDTRRALQIYAEALELLRAIGDMPPVAMSLVAVAEIALEDGDAAQAARRFREALDTASLLGHRESLVGALGGTARLVLRVGGRDGAERSLRLLGAADRMREGTRLALSRDYAVVLAEARGQVGAARAEAFLVEGRHLSLEQALAQAKAALSLPAPVQAPALGLTQREREVISLVARGCSNQQIAETLVIGRRTVEMHVSNLLAKLGLTSRAQLAVWAVAHDAVLAIP